MHPHWDALNGTRVVLLRDLPGTRLRAIDRYVELYASFAKMAIAAKLPRRRDTEGAFCVVRQHGCVAAVCSTGMGRASNCRRSD